MCGISGWVSHPANLTPENIANARQMTELLRHPGPDAGGEWLTKSVYMGHRRLSIIDRSSAANQPLRSPEGRYILSFNGEIYNYLELRDELARKAARLRGGGGGAATAAADLLVSVAVLVAVSMAAHSGSGLMAAVFSTAVVVAGLLFRTDTVVLLL